MKVQRRLVPAGVAALLLAAGVPGVHAQDGFLFGQPELSVTFRAGPMMHRAESPVFDFITSELTLERDDFSAPALGLELGLAVHPRLDVSAGVAWSESETWSEFRDWVDENDQPIEQVTRLRTTPMSVSARFFPLPRGRAVSSLAWLPARVTPYIGAGAALVPYRLQQTGDFISVENGEHLISTQDYQSSGAASTLHARLGTDVWFTSEFGLNLEGRYTHGSGALEGDFQAHERLDLTGVHAALGMTFRW